MYESINIFTMETNCNKAQTTYFQQQKTHQLQFLSCELLPHQTASANMLQLYINPFHLIYLDIIPKD